MKNINGAIVVVAYNRKLPLIRLLDRLIDCDYSCGNKVDLIVSIDFSDAQPDILSILDSYTWEYGELKIIAHDNNLGLKNHVLLCGDYVNSYDFLIMLEDDLYVSKFFYKYALSAYFSSIDRTEVCGVSLYSPKTDEASLLKFEPLSIEGNNIFFAQLPSSWGQMWTRKMWTDFKDWYESNYTENITVELPSNMHRWSAKSWKKIFATYMVLSNKYFIFPYSSYSTNFGTAGEHMRGVNTFQVPLIEDDYDCSVRYNNHCLYYDAFLELTKKSCSSLLGLDEKLDYTVNLKQQKKLESEQLQLTTLKLDSVISSYSAELFPLEMNLKNTTPGNGIYLGKTPKYQPWSFFIIFNDSYKVPFSKGLLRRFLRL